MDKIIYPDGGCAIEGRSMAPPRHASVDRAVDRDAIPAQWAGRDDKVLKAATRRCLRQSLRGRGGRSLRYHYVVRRPRLRTCCEQEGTTRPCCSPSSASPCSPPPPTVPITPLQ